VETASSPQAKRARRHSTIWNTIATTTPIVAMAADHTSALTVDFSTLIVFAFCGRQLTADIISLQAFSLAV